MYRNISMTQRLDRIGELLAKGIFLYLKNGQGKSAKEENKENAGGKNKSANFKSKLIDKYIGRCIFGI
jgi:hypothetical protein